jgi:hypothetical protein
MRGQQQKARQPVPGGTSASLFLQPKLTVNASGDPYELEADRVAERVMHAGDAPLQRSCGCGGQCGSCREKERVQTRRVTPSDQAPMEAPPIVHEALRSSRQPLAADARGMMEARFGHDFSRVRVHTDERAADATRAVDARAYTVGQDIVFGAGQYSPSTPSGQRLLAHELTHVLQQSSDPHTHATVQRDEFKGAAGATAKDKDRPLTSFSGVLPEQKSPGGTIVPNTAGTSQNCAGDSCSIKKYINWPFLGREAPKVPTVADWSKAVAFVPTGCTRVNCSGIDLYSTRCKSAELELITFLYKWPEQLSYKGTPVMGTQSDFHMIGRDADGLPKGWHSKMDRREQVVDIRSPEQSLADAYPHTQQKDRTIQKLCFCCKQSAIATT